VVKLNKYFFKKSNSLPFDAGCHSRGLNQTINKRFAFSKMQKRLVHRPCRKRKNMIIFFASNNYWRNIVHSIPKFTPIYEVKVYK